MIENGFVILAFPAVDFQPRIKTITAGSRSHKIQYTCSFQITEFPNLHYRLYQGPIPIDPAFTRLRSNT